MRVIPAYTSESAVGFSSAPLHTPDMKITHPAFLGNDALQLKH
jgi:hypothetical protein